MTSQEWKEIEKTLSRPYGLVTIEADGHTVDFIVIETGTLKYGIFVQKHGAKALYDVMRDPETKAEYSKFYPVLSRYVHKPNERKRLSKISKGLLKEVGIDPHQKYSYMVHTWSSPKRLISHLKKNCENIKLVPKQHMEIV